MARVLVVEDEEDLQQILAYNLAQAGHEVVAAFTVGDGLREIRAIVPDIVLLDLMLPDQPGIEVLKALRADERTRRTPVILVTARGEEADRLAGFELGADDYVVKPFSVRELLLRIQAVLRRAQDAGDARTAQSFGVLRIDAAAHRVWVDGAAVELTALEFKLLLTLFERRDRVQSRAQLLDDVWDIHADITTRTVDTHVKRLREKLGAAAEYIETVRGVGYRFAATPPR